jgi:hypothetical protein
MTYMNKSVAMEMRKIGYAGTEGMIEELRLGHGNGLGLWWGNKFGKINFACDY